MNCEHENNWANIAGSGIWWCPDCGAMCRGDTWVVPKMAQLEPEPEPEPDNFWTREHTFAQAWHWIWRQLNKPRRDPISVIKGRKLFWLVLDGHRFLRLADRVAEGWIYIDKEYHDNFVLLFGGEIYDRDLEAESTIFRWEPVE